MQLKDAVNACVKYIPKGDCSNSPHGPIRGWGVSTVIDMSNMFSDAREFRGDISKWDVSNVRDMSGMFHWAKAFNSDLSKWEVSSVTNMPDMFRHAQSFNGDISKWDVSSVSNMDSMFQGASLFTRKLCGAAWVHSKARKAVMFAGSSGSISRTVCTATTSTFAPQSREELQEAVDEYIIKSSKVSYRADCDDSPHGPIGEWDVSRVTNMRALFMNAETFNDDISKWDVSRVTDMNRMFFGAKAFNGDLSKWDVSSVTDMSVTFFGARSFNGDISKWDVSSVKEMQGMFMHAESFNGDISKWEVSSVTDMIAMFLKAERFDGDISKWDVSRVKNMNRMFKNAVSFNSDLSMWDVSSVIDMDQMFLEAESVDQKLCGPAWVNSQATKTDMFVGSDGSISQSECTTLPERELIARTQIATSASISAITPTIGKTIACPKCGTFEKSGRKSCCAPGGAWFKNCGGVGNKNVDHKWFDGVAACKRKFTSSAIS